MAKDLFMWGPMAITHVCTYKRQSEDCNFKIDNAKES